MDEAKEKMVKAGFVDVQEHRFKCPVGPWAKDPRLKVLGKYNRLQWEMGIEGWSMMLLTNFLNVSLFLFIVLLSWYALCLLYVVVIVVAGCGSTLGSNMLLI